ncbi:Imm50 family immunity protein [Ramlibacter humi]|uniref:Immunity protein 50 n=1 Tax=Ramlibacter humi TaxID=2530451 RepID=A0A4Z0BHM8_9BURK|nr:Imm50 family immunity protein [Ramlibacter humi]TFY97624.1 hypothetical protein EZ216_18015 [Ramlibacter humi]
MDWFALLENPKALQAYYPAAPDLSGVVLHSIGFRRDGPMAELVIDLPAFPAKPSPRWPVEANTCQVRLQSIDLQSVELSRWGTGVVGDLKVSKTAHGVGLEFSGEAMFRLDGRWLRVESVTGYVRGAF